MEAIEDPASMNESIPDETGLPLRFPDPREEARARAREFRMLSSDERWAEIAALMSAGYRMVRHSPRRDAIRQRWEAEEANWQGIQRKLFEEHGH
jgi:hypothetical protein